VAGGVVGYVRPDDGHGCVGLLGQEFGVSCRSKAWVMLLQTVWASFGMTGFVWVVDLVAVE
jgi:hypothetical protein